MSSAPGTGVGYVCFDRPDGLALPRRHERAPPPEGEASHARNQVRQRMFSDRRDAGRRLAARLMHLKGEAPLVLAIPRGGVAVAREVADALAAPLDMVLVRKIGAPWQPELAVGAV